MGNSKSLLISNVGNSQLLTLPSPLKLNNVFFILELKKEFVIYWMICSR